MNKTQYLTDDRIIHIRAAILSALLALAFMFFWPELHQGVATTFSTVGVLLSFYGIVFTIIEVLRAKSSAKLASDAADKATKRIEALYAARDSTECLSLIEWALSHLTDFDQISPAILARIVRLYSSEFATATLPDTSLHRVRLSMVTSFASFAKGGASKAAKVRSARLITALMQMSEELSTMNAQRLN